MKTNSQFLVDTNYILRYLLMDDTKFNTTVQDFFEKVKVGQDKALILDAVIAECVYVLSGGYGLGRSQIVHALTGLLLYKGIICDRKENLMQALLLWGANTLDFVDCLLLAFHQSDNIPLNTFDAKLKKLAT